MIQKKQLAVAIAATFVASGFVYAQTPQKVEKVEVTGSNIKRIDTETAGAVQVITAEEIRQSGRQTITELLRELPSNAAGGLSELTGSGSFSAGAASISLRGLGSSATLVLLNGRRIAPYGLSDPNFGQSGAVNLNAIPLAVVERIEILKDGASAIYGSEAIAGVVNIITRRDYKGAEVRVSGSTNFDGLYQNGAVVGTIGFGDQARDRFNAFVNVELFRQSPTKFRDAESFLNRQEFRDVYGTGVASSTYSGGLNFLRPSTAGVWSTTSACPADARTPVGTPAGFFAASATGTYCLVDQWKYVEITPKVERNSIFARATYTLNENVDVFAEGGYTDSHIFFAGAPRAVGQGVGGTFSSTTGLLNNIPTSLPATHPNNPTFGTAGAVAVPFRYRFESLGPQDNTVDNKTSRFLLGAKGTALGWDFETGFLYNQSKITTVNYNEVNLPLLTAGIRNGTFNFINPSAGSITGDSLRINAVDTSQSSFTLVDVKGTRDLFKLGGGSAALAVGLEYRREERDLLPDPRKEAGEIFGRGVSRANSSRNVQTAFGELSLPFIKGLDVQLAARHDRYSDYGNSTTPKIAVAYSPTTNLKVRASYAEGFRAPSLTEAGRSATSGFFSGIDDPRRCSRPTYTVGCGISIPGLITGSSFLKAEEAKSTTFGFVFEPTKETSVSVDYFDIKRTNEITFLSIDDILNNEGSTDPRYANRLVRDRTNTSTTVPNDPGAILYVLSGFDNLGVTQVKGLDFDGRWKFKVGTLGQISTVLNATYYLEQKGSGAPDDPLVSYNGFRNAPKWRGQLRGSWAYGSWTTTGTINYLGPFLAYTNPEPSPPPACGNPAGTYLGHCRVGAYTTFDLGVEYAGIKDTVMGVTIRNVANTKPAFDPLARPFNTAWYQPQGINISGTIIYKFR